MPFVDKKHRKMPDFHIPGDQCYIYYKNMVKAWKAEPRWTTAHEIYKETLRVISELHNTAPRMFTSCDKCVSRLMAWQVFFQLYVMPYELKKRKENGDI